MSSPPKIICICKHRLHSPPQHDNMAANVEISLPLPVLPGGWAGEKDFKSVGQLSSATDRNIEPVGPHFLAYARRVRFNLRGRY